MGQADDVERVEAGCRAQPQSLYKRCVAEQGGDAGGGSTLGTQSTFAQMGHIDSPGGSRMNRDSHFEKSPKFGEDDQAELALGSIGGFGSARLLGLKLN